MACLKLKILAPRPRETKLIDSVCYIFTFTVSLRYSQPSNRAEMHRSGTSLVLEWAGKAQAVSVFVLVTQQREPDGLSRGVGFPEGISTLKYCLEFIKSI